ncbi:O-antigen polymerase [Halothece sp. PCC 7418]|uniref:O-antigen ligase family protein n=1 Tax=Halothece sp. (strain PCC 7418) TaxID=65093 RepID=UPI0002A06A4D|nr:O-antigen ligase family protein [Halothece sp. PCC 7418]AFZ43499.1 O-antigen polymerase [Halothece sp. PCC 7418]
MTSDTTTDSKSVTLPQTWQGQWLGWLALATLVTFAWLPWSYRFMVDWPWIIVWQLGFLILGIWLIWMLRQFQLPFKPLGHGLDWAVCAIALSVILSSLFCSFPLVAAKNIAVTMGYGVLLYVTRNWIGNSTLTWERLWMGLGITGGISTVVGLYKWWPQRDFEYLRNPFPLGHHNFVAGYLVLVLPLTIAWSLSRPGWQRITGLAVSGLMLFHLYTTGSRGGMLGIIALATVAVIFAIAQTRGRLRKRLAIALIAGLLAMMIAIITSPRVEHLIQFGPTESNPVPVQIQLDGNMEFRLFLWQGAFNIFQDRPLLGVGPGNMSRMYNLYRPIVSGTSGTYNVQQLHNTPLQLLGELGVLGLGAVVAFAWLVTRLWFRLEQRSLSGEKRLLLYGVGGSLLAYGVSSLTDYQLENIPISTTLLLSVVLLLALADQLDLASPISVSTSQRRTFSLGGIASIGLACFVSFPLTTAMWLDDQARDHFQAGEVSRGVEDLLNASGLVRWDPTYSLELGFQLLKVRNKTPKQERAKELEEGIINAFQEAWQTSPKDNMFLYHLGLFKRQSDPEQAQKLLGQAVQIRFREQSYTTYTYYALATAYLEEGLIDQAITALSLQGLNNPEFLVAKVWNQPRLAELKDAVIEESLTFYKMLLAKLPSESDLYNSVREREILIRWWHQKPFTTEVLNELSPVTQALITAEDSPEVALSIIKTELSKTSDQNPLLLLGAWLDPEEYLETYWKQNTKTDFGDKDQFRATIREQRELRNWISALPEIAPPQKNRTALSIAYRNNDIERQATILQPPELKLHPLPKALNLFPSYPRSFPPLEQLINEIRTEKLNLPHPTQNNFQLNQYQ